MKQVLIPKQELSLKTSFNKTQNESLKILSMNDDELQVYLQEQCNQMPYLYMKNLDIDSDAFLAYDYSKPSLQDEIMNQLQLGNQRYDEEVCEYILSQTDGNGYLKHPFDTLLKQSKYSSSILRYHLDVLHTCEPYGCFAFDLKDCLQIQCMQSELAQSETAYILCDYLEEIALKRYSRIQEKTSLTMDEIIEGIHFIQHCNPKPASSYSTQTTFVNPEFIIEVIDDTISIRLLRDDLEISFQADDNGESELSDYMKQQRSQVQHLISNIQKRNMTLLQIMQYICDVQKEYFLHHKPIVHLTLEMIAKHCGLHISTISRAIMNKSFEFEQHYVPLKRMLTHGGVMGTSQEEIKKRILSIIDNEDKQHPFSDEAIRLQLEEEGIHLSRRVIAKYREACFIFNSSKRKQL